jgi:hypothetical protein
MPISSDILGWINSAASQFGISPDYLRQVAVQESGGNPLAKNPSGASGLFQFMPSTASQYGLTNPFDAQASTFAAAALTKDNYNYLSDKLGRAPTNQELYLAHVQGASGAYKLISNPDTPAISQVGTNAVLQNRGTANMTSSEFAANLTKGITGGSGSWLQDKLGINIGTFSIPGLPTNDQAAQVPALAEAANDGTLFGIDIEGYFIRGTVIVVGFIFVAVGLTMFGGKTVVREVTKAALK